MIKEDIDIEVSNNKYFEADNQCVYKKKYLYKKDALDDIRKLAKHNPSAILTMYICPHCGKYHVGNVV